MYSDDNIVCRQPVCHYAVPLTNLTMYTMVPVLVRSDAVVSSITGWSKEKKSQSFCY